MEKERADVLLVRAGLAETREKARRLIMAGLVYQKTERVDKPGTKLPLNQDLSIKGEVPRYVSRGGLKLEKALNVFDVDVKDQTVLDVGASTGGFTDCALQHGANCVYAVDVGYGQLAWKIRQDPRVVVMERTNFRYADVTRFEPHPTFAVMDVSFISIVTLMPKLCEILRKGESLVSLIKPQFEAGPSRVGKGGIVREASVHAAVLHEIIEGAARVGMRLLALDYSPITGGDGNLEFLGHFVCADPQEIRADPVQIDSVVQMAHNQFVRS
ncbi:TlyA family RNA methyltransferase [Ferroacidibacillus organovorans]|uniref:TlyA family rRNA (Cytidine-2'-O)-methyltransferase n=1 Tax=Ferroacidibacillus organovorans TaxID=1765683 RepID=A0A162TQC4_9BACL|nr:TlyA family RNA methyltransferase [Ferroacidibacillus organovorans]KYP81022.1 hypothetical protein AYJ22_09230 [Ferroacidibacillus organovorans]OAG94287.1 hypothetical protein AYW79_06015 [Ferroacidibacillus organovorans]OPG16474.1 TlyA family rRNA (cytidine-2'-O)-methyltransferase [Ferroacidibacillus organovorans]